MNRLVLGALIASTVSLVTHCEHKAYANFEHKAYANYEECNGEAYQGYCTRTDGKGCDTDKAEELWSKRCEKDIDAHTYVVYCYASDPQDFLGYGEYVDNPLNAIHFTFKEALNVQAHTKDTGIAKVSE